MKRCSKCKKDKEDSEFYPNRTRNGLMSRCKPCGAIQAKEWRDRNPHKAFNRYWSNRDHERERHLKRKYGISFSDYHDMIKSQGGKCAVCSADAPLHKMLDVDHCHKTGTVRGLLCTSCNRMLGNAGDRIHVLVAGAKYLSKTAQLPQVAAEFIKAFREVI